MTLAISSVICRHLKDAASFSVHQGGSLPFVFDGYAESEDIVGWYRNPPPWDDALVVFTTTAIHWRESAAWHRVPFATILHYEVRESKAESTGVRIRTSDGIRFICFAGRSGHAGAFNDAFSLLGLLRVVVLTNKRKADG